MTYFIFRLLLLAILCSVLSCYSPTSNTGATNGTTLGNTKPAPSSTPELAKTPEKREEEKSFSFTVQQGKKITAGVFADPQKPEGKTIIFTPFLEKTDGNLYNAALHSLWAVYGKKRGLFQLADAQTVSDSTLGGNAICWQVWNPTEQYCVFPIKDSETQKIGSIRIWLQ